MATPPGFLNALIDELCQKEEDWALILLICEQASSNAALADEAANSLIRIFSQGGPRHVRLNAARLWAVMLHNCSAEFFERSCSPIFLSVIKEVIDQRALGHPLRDRLVNTLGDAVFSNCQTQPSHPLAQLWRQVKPDGYPDDGISPRFVPPSQVEVHTPDETTPVVEEPRTFLPQASQDTRIVVAAPPTPVPEAPMYYPPRVRTASTPAPINSPARSSFATQFYPQFMFRSSESDIPAVPAPQPASRQDDAPFSFVRQAFTQAIAPVAMAVAPNNVPGTDRHLAVPNSGAVMSRSQLTSTPSPAPTSQGNSNSGLSTFVPLWTSVAATASSLPKALDTSVTTLFASMKAMRGSRATMNLPIPDFCSQVVKLPKSDSGKVIMLHRRRAVGTVTHEFLILEAVTPDGVPMYIRLDRRPLSGQRRALFLLSSAATASDSAIFATCEEPLLASETSKLDAIVPFRDSPSLHDLGKLLWFIETEAPDYRLRKENCWFFCSVIQEVLTDLFRGHNHMGTLAHAELGKDIREKILARARGAGGLSASRAQGLADSS